MWDNARLLNGLANALYGVAAVLTFYGVLMVAMQLPIFPLREVDVTGQVTPHYSRPSARNRSRAAQG